MQSITLKDLVDSAEGKVNQYMESKGFQNYTGNISFNLPSMEIDAYLKNSKITKMEVTQHPSEIKLTKKRGRMLLAERKCATVSKRPYREIFRDLEKYLAREGMGSQNYSLVQWIDHKKPVGEIYVSESENEKTPPTYYIEGERKIPLWCRFSIPFLLKPFWWFYGGKDISGIELLASKRWDRSYYCSVKSFKEYPASKSPADSFSNIVVHGMETEKMERLFDEIDKIFCDKSIF